jgi:hypothetical protein
VWWKCSKGHEWEAVIAHRNNGSGCPYCAGKKVLKGYNDLKTINPDLAKEWNWEKNGDLKPENVTANSGKKVWWKCSKGHEWQVAIASRNYGNGCPICKSERATSFPEYAIEFYLKKYGLDVIHTYREKGYELDIYIPSKKIAIECNGIYWHSKNNSSFHQNKYKECRQKGIQLLTIWEDWIRNKPEIVESIIKSKLGIIENKIGARKCEIKLVESNVCKEFLNNNHIQGFSPSAIKLGLYYNDELVSIMAFSKSRVGIGKKDDGYELVRFCNKLNTNIIGAASKLLKYFIEIYKPCQIISYSSNDISNGNLYDVLGFEKENISPSAYWYINQNTFQRYHRFNFRKAKLKNMGYNTDKLTESQIMNELPYWKIYDSGTTRWVKKL